MIWSIKSRVSFISRKHKNFRTKQANNRTNCTKLQSSFFCIDHLRCLQLNCKKTYVGMTQRGCNVAELQIKCYICGRKLFWAYMNKKKSKRKMLSLEIKRWYSSVYSQAVIFIYVYFCVFLFGLFVCKKWDQKPKMCTTNHYLISIFEQWTKMDNKHTLLIYFILFLYKISLPHIHHADSWLWTHFLDTLEFKYLSIILISLGFSKGKKGFFFLFC